MRAADGFSFAMAGLYEALTFPFALCFGYNARAIAAERKRLMDDVEDAPTTSAVNERATVAENIAFVEEQLRAMLESIAHDDKLAAKKEAEAKKLLAEGRSQEARQVLASRVQLLQAIQVRREMVTGFEGRLQQLRTNAMHTAIVPVMRALAEAAGGTAGAESTQQILDMQAKLKEGLENGQRATLALSQAARGTDVLSSPDGQAAISIQEEVDREMQRLMEQQQQPRIAVPYSPTPPRATGPYIQGVAPDPKPKSSAAAAKRVQVV